MTRLDPPEFDVLGIGFGPSNLALAIALDEMGQSEGAPLCSAFVERQPHFAWHRGMLLPDAEMQISFLKDLVSLRDPTSPLTFVNYLHMKGRLEDFANCRTFHPSRIEFNDYLCWVADKFADLASYGEEIVAVEPLQAGDGVRSLRVVSHNGEAQTRVRHARNIVVSVGGRAHIPALFATLGNHPRLLHSSRYLTWIGERDADLRSSRIAVVGGGQSAAEITVDLHKRLPDATIDLVFRGHALKPSDSSPFVNEIFHPAQTDAFHGFSDDQRREVVSTFRNTNYAVVTPELLTALHHTLYKQKVEGKSFVRLRPRSSVVSAAGAPDSIALTIADRFESTERRDAYDVVILATGYERSTQPAFLEPLAPFVTGPGVDRYYRLPTRSGFEPTIYIQGASEESHGISDTLLSVVSIRAQEIARSIFGHVLADRERGRPLADSGLNLADHNPGCPRPLLGALR